MTGAKLVKPLVAQLTGLTEKTMAPFDVLIGQCLCRTVAHVPWAGAAPAELLGIAASRDYRPEARIEAAAASLIGEFGGIAADQRPGQARCDAAVSAVARDLAEQGHVWAVYKLARRAAVLGASGVAADGACNCCLCRSTRASGCHAHLKPCCSA